MLSAATRAPFELIKMLSMKNCYFSKSIRAIRGASSFLSLAASPSSSRRRFVSSSSMSSSSSAAATSNRLGVTVGFLGAGAMGEAFARGLLAAGVVPASDLRASVRTPERREALAALLGGYENVFGDALLGGARQVAETSDVIILSVKPAAAGKVLESLAPYLDVKRHLIVSIAAGIPLAAIESRLCRGAKVARVMPNTPTLVGSGTSVYCLNDEASNDRGDSSSSSSSSTSSSSPSPPAADVVRAMLEAVGLALPLDESLMDAATGLSGCGPAYVFLMIEALADGGVRAGLPRDVATRLAAATVGGAAQMVLEAGPGRGEGRARGAGYSDGGAPPPLRELAHPAVLRERVCSPGGATIAGVAVLEDAGVRGAVARAVGAAAARAAELASKK